MGLPIDPHHEAEAAAAAGLDSGQGVFDDRRLRGCHGELPRCRQEDGRVWLSKKLHPFGFDAVHHDFEEIHDARSGQDRLGVSAG